ncbi:hypothetical protein CFAM422_006988 [Trichoderma lentiforme]|uniref:Uncharacterized protein n=1 Tax=Trichoderma lentiforme TaxID=1567552 RepID=A0A9P4XEH9_9HYPO|nr:hypothetical protein CFAM422_006988 [Trichoderma lentiforme]
MTNSQAQGPFDMVSFEYAIRAKLLLAPWDLMLFVYLSWLPPLLNRTDLWILTPKERHGPGDK